MNKSYREIQTDRLLLRPYRKEDFTDVHGYASLPNFSQYDTWGPNTEQDTHDFIDRSIQCWDQLVVSRFVFAVVPKSQPSRVIGGCGLYREGQNSHIASIGYSIHPDWQGQGFATELSLALIGFGFDQLELFVIYATCDTRNDASFKVMEKVGMQRVAMLIKDKEVRGQLRDSYRYEITNPELSF